MEIENTKLDTAKEIGICEKIGNKIEFVHKNAGGITLITTSTIAIGSVFIRCFSYLIEFGKAMYYGVPSSLIDVSGDNILYDFFVKGIFALFLILLNLIPYFLWKSKRRIWSKLGWSVAILLSPNVFVVWGLIADATRGIKYSARNVIELLGAGVVIGVVLFFIGLFNGVWEYIRELRKNKKDKHSKTKKVTSVVILLAILIVVESLLLIFCGGVTAAAQNQFKIITDNDRTYAVIYENSEKYLITECTIENGTISFTDINTKQELGKDDVEYTLCRLEQKRSTE